METRGAIAFNDADEGLLTLWCSAQDTHRQLRNLAHVWSGRPSRSAWSCRTWRGVRLEGRAGARGGVVAVAALMQRRPVKWAEDRLENFMAAYQGRGCTPTSSWR